MSIQLQKITWGPKRFVKTPPLYDISEWQAELFRLKELIGQKTQFQIVGHRVYFEEASEGFSLMLEVIGPPVVPDQSSLTILDLGPMEALSYQFIGTDIFGLGWEELVGSARKIQSALANKDKDPSIFHIVLDNEKIGLHFFRQKDYIQNL